MHLVSYLNDVKMEVYVVTKVQRLNHMKQFTAYSYGVVGKYSLPFPLTERQRRGNYSITSKRRAV